MILDALTHVTPDGRWLAGDYDASEDRLLREMDDAAVERAVVVALAGHIDNDFVLAVHRRHPDRLVPGASIDPSRQATPRAAARAVRAALHGAPFPVLKLHPRLNRYDLLDPRCLAVLEEVGGWPRPPAIWVDTLLYFQGARLRRPPVDACQRVVGAFPELDFVLLHAGGPEALALAAAVRDCPRVTLDLSFTVHRYRGSSLWTDLAYLAATFDRRLVFGSDFPEVSIGDALTDLRRLTEAVDDERRQRLMGGNLAAILERHR